MSIKKFLKAVFLCILIFSIFFINACSSVTKEEIPQSGVSKNGRLKVIKDDNGIMRLANEKDAFISLRGMSTYNFNRIAVGEDSQNLLNNNAFSAMRKDWKCNVIRLAVYVRSEDNGYNGMKETTIRNIDKAINLATDNDMYVIVDWHVLAPGDPNNEVYKDAKEFFNIIAKKHGKKKNVMFEIMNEPNSYTMDDEAFWGYVKPYAQEMVDLIRKYSDNIIIIGNPRWSQRPDLCAEAPVEGKNLMYSIHFYAGSHGQELRDNITSALENGVAVFCSEWGVTNNTGNGAVYLSPEDGGVSDVDTWLDFLDKNKISWCNWSMSAKSESSAALLKNTSLNPEGGIWEIDKLSASGKYVRERLRNYV